MIEKKGKDYVDDIVGLLKGKYKQKSGIIYCMTRKETEKLTKELKKKSIKCDYFHAEWSIEEWNKVYENWMKD